MRAFPAFLAAGVLVGAAIAARPARAPEVPYPEGYRDWTHVESGLIGPGNPAYPRFAGFHHVYANEPAMRGYRDGKFPDGSMIVFDVIAVNDNGKGSITEGERRFIDVMLKDPARGGTHGGWQFEEFAGSSKTERALTDSARTACGTCHTRAAANDYVFTKYRP